MVIGNSFLVKHFCNTIWLIKPENLKTMTEVLLSKLMNDGSLNLLQLEPKDQKREYVQRAQNNIAILNLEGVMVPKASQLDAMCGLTSIIELHNIFNELVEDSSIRRIVLYFDSPGGANIGVPEFAESIFQARSKKEIVAFTDTYMCSSAYFLGSAAEKVIATPSSIIGAIGTYATLIKEKENEQLKTYFIQAGDNKLFGNPKSEISDEEIAYFQKQVNQVYDVMVNAIVKFRNISVNEVKDTQGDHYNSVNAPKWLYDELADSNYILK